MLCLVMRCFDGSNMVDLFRNYVIILIMIEMVLALYLFVPLLKQFGFKVLCMQQDLEVIGSPHCLIHCCTHWFTAAARLQTHLFCLLPSSLLRPLMCTTASTSMRTPTLTASFSPTRLCVMLDIEC